MHSLQQASPDPGRRVRQPRLVDMSQPLGRAVATALPGLVASLRAWGVTDAHALPGPHGVPVIWLATGTEAERRVLEAQGWLATQVRALLLRHGVPPEQIADVRVMFESGEGRQALLDLT